MSWVRAPSATPQNCWKIKGLHASACNPFLHFPTGFLILQRDTIRHPQNHQMAQPFGLRMHHLPAASSSAVAAILRRRRISHSTARMSGESLRSLISLSCPMLRGARNLLMLNWPAILVDRPSWWCIAACDSRTASPSGARRRQSQGAPCRVHSGH